MSLLLNWPDQYPKGFWLDTTLWLKSVPLLFFHPFFVAVTTFCLYISLISYRYSLLLFLSVPYLPCSSFVQPSALIDPGLMSQILGMAVPEGRLPVQATMKYGRSSWQVWSCRFCQDYGCPKCQKNIGRSLLIMRYHQWDELFEWPQNCSAAEQYSE